MLVGKEAFKDHEVVHLEDSKQSLRTQWVRTATGVHACPPWGPWRQALVHIHWVLWHMPAMLALGKESRKTEFKVSFSYTESWRPAWAT